MSNQNAPTPTETLLGGTNFEVKLLDGRTEKIRVRQIPVRDMPEYLEAQDKEPAMIELVCILKPDFVDALHPDSHDALIAEIERVNHDFFSRWGKRQKARAERLNAEFVESKPSPSPTSPPK